MSLDGDEMPSDGVEATITSDCLQFSDGKKDIVSGGGYWFEIIELEDENDSHHESQSLDRQVNLSVNKENTTPSFVTSGIDGFWANLPWNCAICLQKYNSVQELIEHNHDMHHVISDEMTWICADCQLTFRIYTLLLNHVRRVHYKNLGLLCDICDKKCVSFEELDEHRREMHNNGYLPPILHCMTCGNSYRNRSHLNRHIRLTHSNENRIRYDCTLCSKNYRSKSSLADHQLTHGTKRFTCDQCGKKFARGLNLQQHLTSHVTVRSYICRLCGKSFKNTAGLRLHMKAHTNKRKRESIKAARQMSTSFLE